MADGGLKLELDETLSERVVAAAKAAGADPQVMAADLIRQALDADWVEEVARYEHYKQTGDFVDAETFVREFREGLEVRLASRRK